MISPVSARNEIHFACGAPHKHKICCVMGGGHKWDVLFSTKLPFGARAFVEAIASAYLSDLRSPLETILHCTQES